MITQITATYTRRYSDTNQVTTYVEWLDSKGRTGRTEGKRSNLHMQALLARAAREGVPHRKETW